jgi:hypothetical protein
MHEHAPRLRLGEAVPLPRLHSTRSPTNQYALSAHDYLTSTLFTPDFVQELADSL